MAWHGEGDVDPEGVLDYGVPGRLGYEAWVGLMGREDTR